MLLRESQDSLVANMVPEYTRVPLIGTLYGPYMGHMGEGGGRGPHIQGVNELKVPWIVVGPWVRRLILSRSIPVGSEQTQNRLSHSRFRYISRANVPTDNLSPVFLVTKGPMFTV
jgi:hypothetical protein